ncbi:hypothetical protein BpHYR1_041498 [Brachionus plicatilis]|uniref:Uncharacterized protein n=1 Tax=Brachionus plicatilis TaxID=10195 RepID=A0A3M7SR05_BRAPC|nr:hypothetical protein BpHYR1_041498 [Brachionus plicatilis]
MRGRYPLIFSSGLGTGNGMIATQQSAAKVTYGTFIINSATHPSTQWLRTRQLTSQKDVCFSRERCKIGFVEIVCQRVSFQIFLKKNFWYAFFDYSDMSH